MNLAEEISRYGSVAVVGLSKNTGKTVTLNHVLREIDHYGVPVGVSSIGIDGETVDSVTNTEKPEIILYPGMIFATGEAFYRQRLIESEILDLDNRPTVFGRTVVARALSRGKVLLSGPPDTASMRRLIERMRREGAKTVIVDGALSRLSPASPAITEAMILATGAAVSPDIDRIVERTAYIGSLIGLPLAKEIDSDSLEEADGVMVIENDGKIKDAGLKSTLDLSGLKGVINGKGKRIYVPGMVGERMLKYLTGLKEVRDMELVVKDFTRIFAEPMTVKAYLAKGGRISVVRRPRLLAVTINPWSPQGYTVNKAKLRETLRSKLDVPVINVMR